MSVQEFKESFEKIFIANQFLVDQMKDQASVFLMSQWFSRHFKDVYAQIEEKQRVVTAHIYIDVTKPEIYSLETLKKVVLFTENLKANKPSIIVFSKAQFCIGKQSELNKDFDAAIEAYNAAITADPAQTNARVSLANIYFKRKDYLKAAPLYADSNMIPRAKKCYKKTVEQFGDSDSDDDFEDLKKSMYKKSTVAPSLMETVFL